MSEPQEIPIRDANEHPEFKIGDTIYIRGVELLITQIRIDESLDGATGMMLLAGPLMYTRSKLEHQQRVDLAARQLELCEAAKRHMDNGGDGLP